MKQYLRCDTCHASGPSHMSRASMYRNALKKGWRISLGDKVMTDPDKWPAAFWPIEKHACPPCATRMKRLEKKIGVSP